MIVMLFLLPETRGRSLESLEARTFGATAVSRMTLEPRPTTAE